MAKKETIRTRIWREEAEPDNHFAAATCLCHGYDVYGDLLGKASWIEYLYLLFKGERPNISQRRLLEDLAVAIANPGPRDHSVQAAMNGGVSGSDNAASLMAALAIGAGQLGGAREVAQSIALWEECKMDLESWAIRLPTHLKTENADVWPAMEHAPGFDPYGVTCTTPIINTLNHLATVEPSGIISWLNNNRPALEQIAGCPLAMTGIAAATFHDLKFNAAEGEMLFLILRLPGAAVHCIEQGKYGYRNYPFHRDSVYLMNDPVITSYK